MSSNPPTACFFDLSDRAKLRVRGGDAARYLQGQLTNDVRRATAEVALYACVLTAKGRLCADVYLRAEPGGGFLIDADPSLREPLLARLDRYIIADDVTVEDVTDALGLLHLPGGDAPAGIHFPVATRADRFGGMGTDVFLPVGLPMSDAKTRLAASACPEGTPTEAETRRITAGVPRWGAELDEDTLPPEAALESRAISYDKGCYIGQETISRLKSIGHVNRHLRRLRAVGPGASLTAGLRLRDAAGREVGSLTSVAGASGLGYVRRGHEAEGTRLFAVDPADPDFVPQEVEIASPSSATIT